VWIELSVGGSFLSAAGYAAARQVRLRAAERLQDKQDLIKSLQVIEQQRRVMEMVAGGASLKELLDNLTASIERIEPGTICTVLLLDEEERRYLLKGSGPSLPPEYLNAINGLEIGPDVGACGSAAFRNETTVVEDIATDYRFTGAKDFVMGFGLRSCWSVPIRNSRNKVLGTFAMYHRVPAKPRPQELKLVEAAAQLAGSAIQSLRSEQRLRETAERLDLAEKAAGFGIWEVDVAGRSVTLSEGLAALVGLRSSPRKQNLDELAAMVHPEDREAVRTVAGEALANGDFRVEFRVNLPNGRVRWARVQGRAQLGAGTIKRATGALIDITDDKNGPVHRATGALIDITEEKQMLDDLQSARAAAETAARVAREAESLELDRKIILEMVARDEPLEHIVEALAHAVRSHLPGCLVAIQMELPGASRIAVSSQLPERLAKAVDRTPIDSFRQSSTVQAVAELCDSAEWRRCAENMVESPFCKYQAVSILQNSRRQGMIIALWPDECECMDDEHKLLESWGQFASLAVERHALYEQLSFRAKHDSLTTLLNRASLYERMDERIRDGENSGAPLTVLYFDLDYFKRINDRLGHDAGDAILRSVAGRILNRVRPVDFAARVGGDEFIVVLPGVGDRAEARRRGESIARAIVEPIGFNGHELCVGASFGIGVFPVDGRDTDSLLKVADKDMYRAKLNREPAPPRAPVELRVDTHDMAGAEA